MADDTDDTEPAADHDSAADVGHDLAADRTTAPMSDYSSRSVGIGFLVTIVGVAISFGIPLVAMGL
ncbi:uncharacterized protein Nmag_3574 [Natrialba magadii ATCC 43099]|uniref:Uncharacterized protein n=1 Tax=Natrialba magadii (strain ATCC 43099 / DSM 3394 / CCM 3739 / CIP 104546 / IAM 13178 / JCM 8861 / NBRC 102185 / NCIMB 2190 / MS3) TaxID=547559 RepID=D3SU35_NATMM|nr:hypothetical protein [Natrialba magadii]ADD07124.1 uncharacterized protein Nmag_3574 [Natrialba magadii ATCC 43099]ELY29100.1 hypothetical protein C500_12345 [Natrialba magadii ATCC 43099]